MPVPERSSGTKSWIPPLLTALGVLVGVQLLLYSALRLVFWLVFGTEAAAQTGDLRLAFALGARFDLRLSLFVALPLALLSPVPGLRPSAKAGRILWSIWIGCALFTVLLAYVSDLGHYGWLHERLDAAVLDELRSPGEAVGMIWQSYPVGAGLLGLALAAWGLARLARALGGLAARPTTLPRRRKAGAYAVGAALAALGIYGNVSWYPLRWSQAFFSPDPFVSALASNPVLYFVETLGRAGPTVDRAAVARDYARLADLLEVDAPDAAALDFTRRVTPAERPPFRPNLVLIHLESWAAFQTGTLGNPLPSSPCFDRLASDSLLFTHGFVPSGPTARSVFSVLTGLPDVAVNNPDRSASRDPHLVRQPTLVDALTEHRKFYFLGGSANWANIRALFAGNIAGIEIHEEGDYPGRARADVWGISDYDLFEEAAATLDACPGPFFAFIQSAGNHPPYTIPSDAHGFERTTLDEETLQQAGFKSAAAFDGFRFLDHALGHFFELARRSPWYRNTVFALYGDHGVPAVNDLPFERMGLVRQHVPLVIHSPALVPVGRRIEWPASSVDLLPTCLSLMGVPYTNTALGRDALAERAPERRFAVLSDGLIQDHWYLNLAPGGEARLYRYDASEPDRAMTEQEPERVAAMKDLHRALLGWALWAQHDAARRFQQEAAFR